MNCDQAIELLPWLVNGTLDPGERRGVMEHLAGCVACRTALADTRTAWELFDWHPTAAALVAHAQAEAAPAAGAAGATAGPRDSGATAQDRDPHGADGIADHLATCPSCAAEMELLRTSRALSDPAADERIALLPRRREEAAAGRTWRRSALAAGVVGLLACTGWFESVRQERALERRLRQESAARATAPAPAGVAAPNHGGAAAGAGVDSDLRRRAGEAEARLQGLARDNRQLQEKVATLERGATELQQRSVGLAAAAAVAAGPPVESASLVEVRPTGQVERGSGEPAETVVQLSSGAADLLLDTRRSDRFFSYEIEIRDALDRPVGNAVRVQPHFGGSQDSPDGFDIVVRRHALSKGAYTIYLFGRGASGKASGESRELLGTYAIRVT